MATPQANPVQNWSMNVSKLPRLITAQEGAAALGLELSQFHHWVSLGRLPKSFPDINKWDVEALHVAIDRLSGIGGRANALDAWIHSHRAG
jgi:hypothetical protein